MSPTPHEVAAGYDRVAAEYAALEGERRWPRMRWLERLLKELEDGSAVLDLGCGNGLPATKELAERHRVVGVDISERQIECARENVPGVEFRVADATMLELRPAGLDAVVSFYMLGHIPRSQHETLLGKIFAWLRPGGYFLLSVEEEDDPDNVRLWLETPMFFSSFSADVVLGLLEQTGFEIVLNEPEVQLEGDQEVPFRWILTRKPGGVNSNAVRPQRPRLNS